MITNRIVFWVAVFALGILTTTPAYSVGPILAYDPVHIFQRSRGCCEQILGGLVDDTETNIVPIGDFGLFHAYVEIFGSRFPTRMAPEQPFASALATPAGFLAAGAGGIVFNRFHFLEAEISYTTTVTNVGDAPGRVVLNYTIPPMEVSFWSGRGITGPSATVRATATSTLTLQDGTILPVEELFLYEMLLIDDDFSTGFTRFSPDVLNHLGSPAFFTDDALIQYKTLEGSLSHDLGLLLPHETLTASYFIRVSTDTGGASEVGMQALFGDPLNLSVPGGGGFSLSLASPAPVPEPATLALLALGLAMAGLLRRRCGHTRLRS